MKPLYLSSFVLVCTLATTGTASAQHSAHQNHGTMQSDTAMPTEPGDASFAAITEIVQLLAQDPDTDWDRVDIDALRLHLVDMTQLIQSTVVETEDIPNGLLISISRAGRAGEAASRMVPAHGPVLAAQTGWVSNVVSGVDTIQWTVTDPKNTDVAQIRSLGFFGLMATGDHHKEHHIAIARGLAAH